MPSKTLEAVAATAALTWGGYHAFVPSASGHQSEDVNRGALRGSGVAQHTSEGGTGASFAPQSIGVAAAAMGCWVASTQRRADKMARKAEAASEVEAPPPFDPAKAIGVTEPFGFFDPAGFSKVGDEEGFRKLRIAEMKHGRVAMMAAVGALFQSLVQFPGFEDVPAGLGAVTSPPGTYGFAALFLFSGALELALWKDDPSLPVDSIGDYGNPLQLGAGEPLGESVFMRNRELNNGRAAMFAAVGIIAAELYTGKNALQQFGF